MSIWTVGHGTRSVDDLIRLLAAQGVGRLVDVRTVPRSRHNPQFNRDRLPDDLARAGIGYVHMPGLGGLRRPRPDSVNLGWRNSGYRRLRRFTGASDFLDASSAVSNNISVVMRTPNDR